MRIPVLMLILAVLTQASCSSSRLYIVRHAEKSTDPPNDPNLTPEGRQRAIDLADFLAGKHIRSVFSTATNRTRQTAEPFASKKALRIETYGNDSLQQFINILARTGQNCLVVGHSNTVLTMLDGLQLPHAVKKIADNDYDNLFIVTIKPGRADANQYRLSLKETTYGKLSPSVTDTTRSAIQMK